MSIPITYSLIRYLAAKKSVDDRALNWRVWQRLVTALPRATTEQPLHILEVGADICAAIAEPAERTAKVNATATKVF